MNSQTLLYIIIAGIIALLLALFQYKYKSNKAQKTNAILAFLRFLTVFGVLLLLINPKFKQITIYNEKPNLVIAIDNSNSIAQLKQTDNVKAVSEAIKNNSALQKSFNVDVFSFSNKLNTKDSLTFSEKQTNISKALQELNQIYKNTVSPTILITDGNQTYGNDYEYIAKQYNQPIYPIIVGDTTKYVDLELKQLNVNKYAFLKNKFPIEAIVTYNGSKAINTKFLIKAESKTVYSQTVQLSKNKNSQLLNITLPTNTVGVKTYKATILPLSNEKNKVNNSKNFAVEVIDEHTKVAIVSNTTHPDIGALKKAIETNKQRKVTILKPEEIINKINDFQLVILYQPNNLFNSVFQEIKRFNKNKFIISGPKTDINFLNTITQDTYKQDVVKQTEDYQATLNTHYNTFIVEDLNFNSFPPLYSTFGEPTFSVPIQPILYKKVGNIDTEEPLLATFETNNRREAILFGENIWKWRAQSYINTKGFNAFDNFIGKLTQYLTSNKRKNRLNVDYQSFYKGNNNVIITAQFFNKNYEFDANENLLIVIKNKQSKATKTVPFILQNNNYQVDLSSLPAADYSFTVKATKENISQSGNFKILEYNVEQQFLNANATKLKKVATNSKGKSYFTDNYNSIISHLTSDTRYKLIQKSTKQTTPLIDFKYLLALITLTLAAEWFIRKYNGLI